MIVNVKSPTQLRLSEAEAKKANCPTELSLKPGDNEIPDALADNWYVKALVGEGKAAKPAADDDNGKKAAGEKDKKPGDKPAGDKK